MFHILFALKHSLVLGLGPTQATVPEPQQGLVWDPYSREVGLELDVVEHGQEALEELLQGVEKSGMAYADYIK